MNSSLKNKFKTDYENLSEIPSGSLWDKIDNQLKKENIEVPEKNSSLVWKIAAIFLVLFSIGILLKLNISTNNPMDNNIVNSKKIKTTKRNIEKITKTTQNIVVNDKLKTIENTKKENKILTVKKDSFIQKSNSNIINNEGQNTVSENNFVQSNDKVPNPINEQKNITENLKTESKEKIKYVSADELLFEREANKTLQNQNKNQKRVVNIDNIQKPKEIKILGVTVYADEQ